ncbi:MAG: hypothetical protein JEY94_14740 [Melioribacteraceae bacterium]|nr:hypothetical protein [Melioribacteraceae bacterium]
MNKIIKIALLIVIFPLLVNASGGGSVYSRYGVGERVNYFSARSLSLGALGVSSISSSGINLINPAANYKLSLTRFEASFSFENLDLQDSENSAVYNNSGFSGFSVGIPLQRDWGMTMVFGVTPYTSVGYEVITDEKDDYTERFIGDGGISKLYLSGTYKLPYDIILGASLDYYTGTISNQSVVEFVDANKVDGGFENKRKYQGAGVSLGVISPDVAGFVNIEKLTDIHLALSYSLVSDLKTTDMLLTGKAGEFEKVYSNEVKSNIPSQLGIGFNLKWDKDYLILFDYIYSSWKDYEFNSESYEYMKNLSRLGIGFEYQKSDINQYSTIGEQMSYRAGFSYEKKQLVINGNEIDQLGVHAGFSFPTGFGSNIDFGFMYGIRGTTDNGLLKENFFQADLTLSFGELWFVRQDR